MDPIVKSIPLSEVVPSKHQARKAFDEAGIESLAESMKLEGLLNPVVVREVGAALGTRHSAEGSLHEEDHLPDAERRMPHFELISGERRLRAAKLLGWETIEAKIIQTSSEAEAAAKGLVENLQREDLNAVEEAEGFQELSQLDPKYWTQEKVGALIGKGQGYVSRSLGLLGLPEPILESMRRRILSRDHGIELLRINNANSQKSIANQIAKGGWSVKQTRTAIDKFLEQGKKPAPKSEGRAQKLEDPLAETWEKAQEATKGWAWDARHPEEMVWDFSVNLTHLAAGEDEAGQHAARGTRHAAEGSLDKENLLPDAARRTPNVKTLLGQWFLVMAEALGQTKLDHQTAQNIDMTNVVSAAYMDMVQKLSGGEIGKDSEKGKN